MSPARILIVVDIPVVELRARWYSIKDCFEESPLTVCVGQWKADRFQIDILAAKGWTMHVNEFASANLDAELIRIFTIWRADKMLARPQK